MAATWHNAHFQIYHEKRHRESYNGMINEENKPGTSQCSNGRKYTGKLEQTISNDKSMYLSGMTL